MSVNQSIRPITTKINNKISIGGCNLEELAKKYGTPLYVMDEASLRKIAQEYKIAFDGYKNIKMMYASKALCNLTIIKILDEEGFGFDTVSQGEIYTAIKAGIKTSNIIFNGSNKTKEELEYAIDYGVGRISVDNFYEAEILNKICQNKNKSADVLLRITPGIECHTHDYIQTGQIDSKFGFDMSQIDAILDLIINKYKNLNLKGLHAHIGSQIFKTKCFEDEIEILVREISRIQQKFNINLSELNIGGGIGVKYTEKDNPPAIKDFADSIKQALKLSTEKYDISEPTIYIEPGRSIVSNAGVTLYTVGSTKQVPNGKKYVAVDGGMADNPRPALYQANYFAELVNDYNRSPKEKVTIVGRYCESGDVLIEGIELPILKENDILCVYNTGAYNYSMASNYNKTKKPAMVLVNNSQSDIIVYGESLEDLISKEVIPDRLK